MVVEDGSASSSGEEGPTSVDTACILDAVSLCQLTLNSRIEEVKVDISIIHQDMHKLRDRVTQTKRRVGQMEYDIPPLQISTERIQHQLNMVLVSRTKWKIVFTAAILGLLEPIPPHSWKTCRSPTLAGGPFLPLSWWSAHIGWLPGLHHSELPCALSSRRCSITGTKMPSCALLGRRVTSHSATRTLGCFRIFPPRSRKKKHDSLKPSASSATTIWPMLCYSRHAFVLSMMAELISLKTPLQLCHGWRGGTRLPSDVPHWIESQNPRCSHHKQ